MKKCIKCGSPKSYAVYFTQESSVDVRKKSKRGWYSYCKTCLKQDRTTKEQDRITKDQNEPKR